MRQLARPSIVEFRRACALAGLQLPIGCGTVRAAASFLAESFPPAANDVEAHSRVEWLSFAVRKIEQGHFHATVTALHNVRRFYAAR